MKIDLSTIKNRLAGAWIATRNFLQAKLNMKERDVQIVMYLAIIVLLNVAAATLSVRFDLTRNDTYSLSERSREVVSGLQEDMKIKVFFSQDLPAEHAAIFRYLKDMLDEYDYYGNRHFSYEIVDQKDLEKVAADYGVSPVTSREFADDQVKIRKAYMAVVIQHADMIEKIDALTETQGLEFRLTSLMEKMTAKIDGLMKMKGNISVRLYMDGALQSLPIDGIGKVEQIVRDAVERTNGRNFGKLTFECVDPSRSNSTDEIVALYGLSKLRWAAGRGVKGGEGVFGLVVQAGDQFRAMNLNLSPTLFGNYVVTGLDQVGDSINDMIGALMSRGQKIGYVTSGGTVDSGNERDQEGAALFRKIIEDMYQVVDISLDEAVPEDVSVIIINGPREAFSEYQVYNIDQHLMRGRSALFLVDSFQEMQMNNMGGMFGQEPLVLPVNTGLDGLLSGYGVQVKRNIVLDGRCARLNLGSMVRDVPLFPMIEKTGLNRDSVITRYLTGALFIKASEIGIDAEKVRAGGDNAIVLVSSSPYSWTMEGRVSFNPFTMGDGDGEMKKPYPLAVALSGRLESYFRGREMPVPEKKPGEVGKTPASAIQSVARLDETIKGQESRIVVVGTSEITRSWFIVNAGKIMGNTGGPEGNPDVHLLHSMVDYLAGNFHVPAMKSKALDYNPLEKTEDSTRFILKAVNIGGVPLAVIIGGLAMWRMRRIRRERIRMMFAGVANEEKR